MNRVQYSFARKETKYLLSCAQYTAFCISAKQHLEADAYGKTTVCNLYYDTDDFALIRRSLEKPNYKEKLRLRSYGIPQEDTPVFLEIKKKYDGVVYKRRISIALQSADAVFQRETPPSCQIGREIEWFLCKHTVTPRVFLAYERTAFTDKQDSSVRITFDENLRYRTDGLDLRLGDAGSPILQSNKTLLMELKLSDGCPLWLCRTLCECRIFPTSFSKYGTVYQRFLLPNQLHAVSASAVPQPLAEPKSNFEGGSIPCFHPSYPNN